MNCGIVSLRYCVLPARAADVDQHDRRRVAPGINGKHVTAAVAAKDHQAGELRCGWGPCARGVG
jgi:hypothetical protein